MGRGIRLRRGGGYLRGGIEKDCFKLAIWIFGYWMFEVFTLRRLDSIGVNWGRDRIGQGRYIEVRLWEWMSSGTDKALRLDK